MAIFQSFAYVTMAARPHNNSLRWSCIFIRQNIKIRNMKKIADYAWPLNFDIYRELIFKNIKIHAGF